MIFKIKTHFLLNCILIVLFSFSTISIVAQAKKFVLVIDAGHGGHDPGAVGSITREKDINLDVSLKLGDLISKNFNNVDVIYTRKTDVYLTLQRRADIVNDNHADLFICIHTNAAKSTSAVGSETFTLGLAKSKANLDVAMRENSVILLEDDYKSKYKGFDPSSVDSYIMFEFMQDKYIDKSVEFASNIQKQFVKSSNRSDRGVRQAGFWVLLRSACPSVLVELGFISNKNEEKFLASQLGQKKMATSIYNAFVNFKHEHDKKSGVISNPSQYKEIDQEVDEELDQQETNITDQENKPNTVVNAVAVGSDIIFKVQILASTRKLRDNASDFKGLRNVNYYIEKSLYKYTVGEESDYSKIVRIRKDLLKKFPDAFIIAFVNGEKTSAKEALRLINK